MHEISTLLATHMSINHKHLANYILATGSHNLHKYWSNTSCIIQVMDVLAIDAMICILFVTP